MLSAEQPRMVFHANLETNIFHVCKVLVEEGMLVREENKGFS